jgi:hypothetical protein
MNTAHSSPLTPSPAAGQGAGRSAPTKPRNSCHRCGASAYKTLIARDDTGAMRPSGQYQCVQCKQVFRDVREWRDGVDVAVGHSNAPMSATTGLVN